MVVIMLNRTEKVLEDSGISVHPPKRNVSVGPTDNKDPPKSTQVRLRRSDVHVSDEDIMEEDQVEGEQKDGDENEVCFALSHVYIYNNMIGC